MEFVWKTVAMIVVLACVAIIAGVVNLIMNRRKIDPKVGIPLRSLWIWLNCQLSHL
jgi:Ca2+/Na+ antiporter